MANNPQGAQDAQPVAPGGAAQANPHWRGYATIAPIAACKLSRADLKRLYALINARQTEIRAATMLVLAQQPNETAGQYAERRAGVAAAFVTGVVVNGDKGESVSGDGDYIFDEPLAPDRIVSITIDTSFSPQNRLNFTPDSVGSVYLDFSRPPLLNFNGLPTSPTPNNSAWTVKAKEEAWFVALSTQLQTFFRERSTKLDWLHGPATYDLLLLLLGAPLSLWGSYRLGKLISTHQMLPDSFMPAIYVYGFFLSANIFRALFSYSRWIFPKVELDFSSGAPLRHRALWYALAIGIVGSALYDGIKTLF